MGGRVAIRMRACHAHRDRVVVHTDGIAAGVADGLTITRGWVLPIASGVTIVRVLVLAAVWAALFAGAALAQTAPSTTAPAKAGALPPPQVPPMQIAIVRAVNTG